MLVQDWFSVPEKNNGKLTEVYPDRGVFRAFFFSCKANARVKLAKTGHGMHSSKLVVICVVLCSSSAVG